MTGVTSTLQILNMAALTIDALRLTRTLFAEVHTLQAELRRQILEREKATDSIQHEMTTFLARVLTGMVDAIVARVMSEVWDTLDAPG